MSEGQLRLLELGGTPYEIGYIHGREGKEEIKGFLDVIIKHGMEVIPDLTMEKALFQARLYIPFIEAYAPHLAEEIEGIAEGAEISVEEAYLLQLRAELTQLSVDGEVNREGCTSFAFKGNMTEDGKVWMGQNLDLSRFYKDFGVMLHIAPEGEPRVLCYTQIGSLGHNGINSAGIGLATNALFSSDWRIGIPRPILYRLILEKESVSEAIEIVTDARRASSCNYLISHKSGEIRDIEATAEYYSVIDIQENVMVHTNHFAHPGLAEFDKLPEGKLESSHFRENRFRQLVTDHHGKLSMEKVKGFLTDHERYPASICRHTEGGRGDIVTIASIICQPADGLMHVSLGQGCKNKYTTYALYCAEFLEKRNGKKSFCC